MVLGCRESERIERTSASTQCLPPWVESIAISSSIRQQGSGMKRGVNGGTHQPKEMTRLIIVIYCGTARTIDPTGNESHFPPLNFFPLFNI